MRPRDLMTCDTAVNRMGFSINISVDLRRLLHFNMNKACQSYSVWARDIPGVTNNWYFIMQNVYELYPNGEMTAIQWCCNHASTWHSHQVEFIANHFPIQMDQKHRFPVLLGYHSIIFTEYCLLQESSGFLFIQDAVELLCCRRWITLTMTTTMLISC